MEDVDFTYFELLSDMAVLLWLCVVFELYFQHLTD